MWSVLAWSAMELAMRSVSRYNGPVGVSSWYRPTESMPLLKVSKVLLAIHKVGFNILLACAIEKI